ncbi:MAG: hypothetical protein M9888_08320 [Chitinophagales bacterium]|nr:hypothetical protein [Chitinophagales bacterium]
MPTYKEVGDTIRLSTNYTGWNSGIQYKMGKKKDSYHSLYANASNSKSDLIHADSLIAKSKSLYSSLGYRYNINNKWNVGVSVDFTNFDAGDQRETRRIGVTGFYGITVAKYLNFRAQLSYRTNSVEKIKDGQVITSNFSIQYKHPKHHLLSLNINQLYRDTKILTSKNEFRVRLNYSYSFTSKNKSK